ADAISGNASAVGGGVEVRLSHRRGDGQEDSSDLGHTFTNSRGQYSLGLPAGTTSDTCRYVVSVGDEGSGTLTRAFVTTSAGSVDIDFNSEAEVRLILDRVAHGDNLCRFSSSQLADI